MASSQSRRRLAFAYAEALGGFAAGHPMAGRRNRRCRAGTGNCVGAVRAVGDWLAHHDVGSVKGPLLQTARDAARGRLVTFGAGLFAAGALIFTALNFNLLRRNSERADQWQRRTYELTEQGQVTDRYTKAVEQLGSDKLDVRIGAIYALERIARDSAKDHPTVMEVLAAFVREHSNEQWPRPLPEAGAAIPQRTTRPDVRAAVTVIGGRDSTRDQERIDLTGANLTRANLPGRGPHWRGPHWREPPRREPHRREPRRRDPHRRGPHRREPHPRGPHRRELRRREPHRRVLHLLDVNLTARTSRREPHRRGPRRREPQ